jgi:hypothetical protein
MRNVKTFNSHRIYILKSTLQGRESHVVVAQTGARPDRHASFIVIFSVLQKEFAFIYQFFSVFSDLRRRRFDDWPQNPPCRASRVVGRDDPTEGNKTNEGE